MRIKLNWSPQTTRLAFPEALARAEAELASQGLPQPRMLDGAPVIDFDPQQVSGMPPNIGAQMQFGLACQRFERALDGLGFKIGAP